MHVAGNPQASPATILLEVLVNQKGMKRDEVESLLETAGLSLPPPVVKQRSDVQVTADLQRKTRALELRKEEHEALQLKLVAAQDGVNKKAQQILCLEEDILELKKSL